MISRTVLIVLLFSALFVFIGWAAPMLAYAHAPGSYFIEENEFYAENVTTGDDEQTICFDRTMHMQSSGTVFIELYIVTEDGDKIEVMSDSDERYFQQGDRAISQDVSLPEDLEPGEYRYERVYRMDVYKGSVTRTFSFTSDPFYVTEDETQGRSC